MGTRWLGLVLALAVPVTILAAVADHLGQTYHDQAPQPGPALLTLTVGVLAGVLFGFEAGTPVLLACGVAASGMAAVAGHLVYAAGSNPALPLDAACQGLPLFCLAVSGVLVERARREGSVLRRFIVLPLVPLWCAQPVAHAALETRGTGAVLCSGPSHRSGGSSFRGSRSRSCWTP